MKIIYIAETSLTNKSAYSHHVIKMCDAFVQLQNNLTLLIPKVQKNFFFKKLRKKYLLNGEKNFTIKSVLDHKLRNFIFRIIFSLKVIRYIKKEKPDLILTRSIVSSFFLSLFKINHFLEIHSEMTSITNFLMINLNFINSKYIIKIILISKALNKIYRIKKDKILILHDGVDIKNFSFKKPNIKIKNATYIGSFYKGRGIDLITKLANKFKKINFNLYGQQKNFKKLRLQNIKIFKHIDYQKVPKILSKADLLLMPYENQVFIRHKNINTANYCSPLKMFDYLAAGRVILSSKLAGICEVLKHNNNAIVINKYDSKTWIEEINHLLNNKYNLKKIRINSIKTAKKYQWKMRAEKILKANVSLNN